MLKEVLFRINVGGEWKQVLIYAILSQRPYCSGFLKSHVEQLDYPFRVGLRSEKQC